MSRPHGRAKVSRNSPVAWARCDRCGFIYNHNYLQWQYEWFGPRTQSTNMLVCETCLDDLQEQLRTFVIPIDPVPIEDPRQEQYVSDNNPVTGLGTNIGTMTQAAGLAAAFDSNSNKPMFLSACQFVSNNGDNTVGKYWGNSLTPDNQGITASGFQVWAPNDAKFYAGGATTYSFEGSNENVLWTVLSTGTTAGTVGETLDVTLTPTTGYLYHRFNLQGNGVYSVAVAQLKISSVTPP